MVLPIAELARSPRTRRAERRLLDRAVPWAVVLALLLTGASWFADRWWLPELVTHFRPHLAAGLLLLAAIASLRRRLPLAGLAAVLSLVNGSVLLPYVVAGAGAALSPGPRVRLMAANVSYWNADHAALEEAVRQEDPDVLGLVEVTPAWVDELGFLKKHYPYAIVHDEEGAYGLALFSRLPMRELAGSPYVAGGIQTALSAGIELEQTPVTLMLGHLRAPTTPSKAALRNEQIRILAGLVRNDANDAQILMGDLNTTQWSPHYRILETDAGLTNAALGRGYIPTWPAGLGPLKVPIDHCLVSEGLTVHAFRTGSSIGSDHLPIVADIGITAATPAVH